MTDAPYFHIGMLVDDLDVAIASYGETLGLQFTAPVQGQMDDFIVRGVRTPTRVRFAYSLQGAPYYELIEAQDEGFYGRAALGFHHVGMWAADPDATIAEYSARGIEPEAVNYRPDGSAGLAYFPPSPLLGVRHEILSESSRPAIEGRIRDALGESA